MRRLSSANRWLIAGSVALTGVLTDVAASAFPGHSRHTAAKRPKAAGTPLKVPAEPPRQATTQPAPEKSAPAQPPAPSEATAPAETPAEESHAAPETTAEAPVPETHAQAPVPEPSEPVVSGGS